MVYKVESAFKKDELREILKDIAQRLEKNFLFSMSQDKKKHLGRKGVLDRTISSTFSDNDFPLSFMSKIKQFQSNKWVIRDGTKDYIIVDEKDRIYVYAKSQPSLNLKDIKGIIMAEIIKRDPCLIFMHRDKLRVTIDNIPKWDKEMGKRKACHKKEKRVKKYKKRLDRWWKKASKEMKNNE